MWGALSNEKPGLSLQLLLILASAVILESESHGTRDHVLEYQIRDFPFHRLLRLAGQRWRYSTPPPHGFIVCWSVLSLRWVLVELYRYHLLQQSSSRVLPCYCALEVCCSVTGNVSVHVAEEST
jgi:hypothetical protein